MCPVIYFICYTSTAFSTVACRLALTVLKKLIKKNKQQVPDGTDEVCCLLFLRPPFVLLILFVVWLLDSPRWCEWCGVTELLSVGPLGILMELSQTQRFWTQGATTMDWFCVSTNMCDQNVFSHKYMKRKNTSSPFPSYYKARYCHLVVKTHTAHNLLYGVVVLWLLVLESVIILI